VVDAEAAAILAGLRLGLELQVESLVLESDSQVAIEAARNKTHKQVTTVEHFQGY
jgi:ribonuclease HI